MKKQQGFGIISIIIIVLTVVIVGVVGWRLYDANMIKLNNQSRSQTSTNNTTRTGGQATPVKPLFKVPELNVQFEIKDGITPLYTLREASFGGISYQVLDLSTQQLAGKASACSFDSKNISGTNHALTSVFVFNNAADALTFERNYGNSHLQASDIASANGYLQINQKVYAVPDGILAGGGQCSGDQSFETAQWNSLHSSLLTLASY